jgi:hypothetical protein
MNKVELLREDAVAPRFRKAMRNDREAVIAVPYWGKGAIGLLGIKRGANIRIICNIDHPGCNPYEIEDIRNLNVKVWTHPRLHAKIYATPRLAIVGSSNVSSNGLAVEGSASRAWIEANIASGEQFFVDQVQALFGTIFDDPDTRLICNHDIARAKERRASFPPSLAELPRGQSLFDAARAAPEAFAPVYVAAYRVSLDKEARARLREADNEVTSQLETRSSGKLWGYQFANVPRDAWVVDLNCRNLDRPSYRGTARILGAPVTIIREGARMNDLSLALRGPIYIGGRKYNLNAAEKDALAKAAKAICRVETEEMIPLAQALRIIDRKRWP